MSVSESQFRALEVHTGRGQDEFEAWIDDVFLSEMQLLVLWMRQYGELSPGQISDALDISSSDVYKHLRRVGDKLEKAEMTYQEVDERVL